MPTETSSPETLVEFVPPQIAAGDFVYWYRDPLNLSNPDVGIVIGRPGSLTVTVLLIGSPGGFIEKPSVRHKDDPGLQENADWRVWGCWEYSPLTTMLKKFEAELPRLAALSERVAILSKQQGNSGKNG